MGIYIPGMKMPKDEKAIHLEIHSDGTVLMWQMGDDDKVVGTAIELPPHGRLGDLDAMAAKDDADYEDAMECIADISTRSIVCKIHYGAQKMIAEAETILPAEGGDAE